MPNDNSVGADLSQVTTDLGTVETAVDNVEGIVNKGLSLEGLAQGHVRVTSTSATDETVLDVGGPALVGGKLLTGSLSGATAEMKMFDGVVSDANKVGHTKASANSEGLCCASPANVLDSLTVQLKSDGVNEVEGLVWIVSAKPVSNPTVKFLHNTEIQQAAPTSRATDGLERRLQQSRKSTNNISILLEIDLSEQPFGREVDVATFRVQTANGSSDTDDIGLWAVKQAWIYDEASWNNRKTGVPWNEPGLQTGGDIDASPIDFIPGPFNGLEIIEVDVTDWVQAVLNGERENYGFYFCGFTGWNPFAPMNVYMIDEPTYLTPEIQITYK